jgi:assimilatory nitrate reductase catalytic subunit
LELFAESTALDEGRRAALLSGRKAGPERGRTVCACFNVGLTAILKAIREDAASDAKQLGQLLRAGTNCGSCVPELKEIIRQETRIAAE